MSQGSIVKGLRARTRMASATLVLLASTLLLGAGAGACKRRGPELTCKANDVCFVCPDEKAQAKCLRDPSSARCKYAEPSHCK